MLDDEPEVQVVTPKDRPKGEAGRDPNGFWGRYYQKNDDSAEQLRDTVAELRQAEKLRDVEAALRAYLTYRTRSAQPWMYEALALAIEANKGDAQEVDRYFGYAADLALRVKDPGQLVHVADALFLRGQYDRVGPLVDAATEALPHRAEPLMMSVNLAQKARDPKRMGDAIEGLLSMGWPGYDVDGRTVDDKVRRDARAAAETLAQALREDGQADEADALLARLPDSEARDVYIRLSWAGTADLDLIVDEPLGATARYESPRTVFGGAILKNGDPRRPEEVYTCPRGFDGEYTVRVEAIFNDPEAPVSTATLEILLHEGTPDESKITRTLDLAHPEPVAFKLEGGRRKAVLPFIAPTVVVPRSAPRVKDRGDARQAPADPKAKDARPAPRR